MKAPNEDATIGPREIGIRDSKGNVVVIDERSAVISAVGKLLDLGENPVDAYRQILVDKRRTEELLEALRDNVASGALIIGQDGGPCGEGIGVVERQGRIANDMVTGNCSGEFLTVMGLNKSDVLKMDGDLYTILLGLYKSKGADQFGRIQGLLCEACEEESFKQVVEHHPGVGKRLAVVLQCLSRVRTLEIQNNHGYIDFNSGPIKNDCTTEDELLFEVLGDVGMIRGFDRCNVDALRGLLTHYFQNFCMRHGKYEHRNSEIMLRVRRLYDLLQQPIHQKVLAEVETLNGPLYDYFLKVTTPTGVIQYALTWHAYISGYPATVRNYEQNIAPRCEDDTTVVECLGMSKDATWFDVERGGVAKASDIKKVKPAVSWGGDVREIVGYLADCRLDKATLVRVVSFLLAEGQAIYGYYKTKDWTKYPISLVTTTIGEVVATTGIEFLACKKGKLLFKFLRSLGASEAVGKIIVAEGGLRPLGEIEQVQIASVVRELKKYNGSDTIPSTCIHQALQGNLAAIGTGGAEAVVSALSSLGAEDIL